MTNPIPPTTSLPGPVKLPEKYQDTVKQFLRELWNGHRREMQKHFGFHGLDILTDDQLLAFPLADSLQAIAQAAAGEIERGELSQEDPCYVQEHIQTLMELLFAVPGLGHTYSVPPAFWDTDMGQMVARAIIWMKGDELITQAEAANMIGVSIQAVSQAVELGRLTRYTDPDAPQRQGRTLVSRQEVEILDWRKSE